MRTLMARTTRHALEMIVDPRFYATERGFQGRLNSALQERLVAEGFLRGGQILEEEYQKSERHGTFQRPDLVLHTPAERTNAGVRANNVAVWALKRRASGATATEDFDKLDEMFAILNYAIGFFVNVDSTTDHRGLYRGRYSNRLLCISTRLDHLGRPRILFNPARPEDEK